MAYFSPTARPQGAASLSKARQQQRIQEQVAADSQDRDQRAQLYSSAQAMRIAAIRNGAVPESLPDIHPHMSPKDLMAAGSRIAPLAGTHLPFSAGLLGGSGLGAGRGLSAEEAGGVADAARLKLGYPSREEESASAATVPKIAAAALTGQTVQTPYGTVSSRPPNWQDNIADKYGKNWQQDVIDKYPKIGQAGTPENAQFVAAVKMAHEDPNSGYEKDPMKIADFATSTLAAEPTGPVTPFGKGTVAAGGAVPAQTTVPPIAQGATAVASSAVPADSAPQFGAMGATMNKLGYNPSSPNPTITPPVSAPPSPNVAQFGPMGKAMDSAGMGGAPAAASPPMPFSTTPPHLRSTAGDLLSEGAAGASKNATDPQAALSAFSRNPEDEQYQKKYTSNPPSLFQN